jgi:hypothetical protein
VGPGRNLGACRPPIGNGSRSDFSQTTPIGRPRRSRVTTRLSWARSSALPRGPRFLPSRSLERGALDGSARCRLHRPLLGPNGAAPPVDLFGRGLSSQRSLRLPMTGRGRAGETDGRLANKGDDDVDESSGREASETSHPTRGIGELLPRSAPPGRTRQPARGRAAGSSRDGRGRGASETSHPARGIGELLPRGAPPGRAQQPARGRAAGSSRDGRGRGASETSHPARGIGELLPRGAPKNRDADLRRAESRARPLHEGGRDRFPADPSRSPPDAPPGRRQRSRGRAGPPDPRPPDGHAAEAGREAEPSQTDLRAEVAASGARGSLFQSREAPASRPARVAGHQARAASGGGDADPNRPIADADSDRLRTSAPFGFLPQESSSGAPTPTRTNHQGSCSSPGSNVAPPLVPGPQNVVDQIRGAESGSHPREAERTARRPPKTNDSGPLGALTAAIRSASPSARRTPMPLTGYDSREDDDGQPPSRRKRGVPPFERDRSGTTRVSAAKAPAPIELSPTPASPPAPS